MLVVKTFWALLLTSAVQSVNKDVIVGCVRYTRFHYLVHDMYTLSYLDHFAEITNELLACHDVNNITASIVLKGLESASHTLCDVGTEPNGLAREKRQLLIGGAAGVLAGLALPAIIQSILHPYSTSPETLNFMKKTRSIARHNAQMINTLRRRLAKIEERQEADELLLTIVESLHLEQEKFRELVESNGRFSTTLQRMMKEALRYYEKLNVIQISPRAGLNPIPEKAYHLNITTTRGATCKEAKVELSLYVPLGSPECEVIETAEADYILTKIGESNDCRVHSPLFTLVRLPDGTSLSPLNHYILKGCQMDKFTFKFDEARRILLAVPKEAGAIVSSCNGLRQVNLEARRGLTPYLGCSSYLASGHQQPSTKDLFSPSSYVMNQRGEFVDPGLAVGSDFLFLEDLTNLSISTTKPDPRNEFDLSNDNTDDDLPALETMNTPLRDSIMILCTTLIILTAIALIFYMKKKLTNSRSYTIEQAPAQRKWTSADIQVVSPERRSSALVKLAALTTELSGINSPRTPNKSSAYTVELLPMPNASSNCSKAPPTTSDCSDKLQESSSFSSNGSEMFTP